MYLKSIEVQGFKSFANKILFDFHKGITGIVGPNGSGKSNVADAVRWVLGEQSAKQLRGSKMEDVIFAGTQARKPVGFAYVAITLDNSDHALPVDYNEVTISRRVYRSGESEYQINGNGCRLKDITELFYDTGIGKEGYSIIGQGQIDKILSGKPEERRELFDEAAGIVKFKRRKAAAVKKLENERNNLVRVNDILSELEKQVGPLERQSDKAKEYLNLKSELKTYDVNAFLLETDRIRKEASELDGKLEIAENDLNQANLEYESTKAEYTAAEEQLNEINTAIEESNEVLSENEVEKQRLEGEINVLSEQIKTIESNNTHYTGRIARINADIAERDSKISQFQTEREELSASLEEIKEKQDMADAVSEAILAQIQEITDEIERHKNKIFDNLNQKSSIKAENQKYTTMIEQLEIRKAELNSRIIAGKSEENAQAENVAKHENELSQINFAIDDLAAAINMGNESVSSVKDEIAKLNAQADKSQQQYHREKSRLESLVNITERYDGYGNSIRKVMEQKENNPGILGVIADIVKVERKYEVAIETALGGTIQNIVTDNEQTAKNLISYLKENKFGRATFLPLSSIQARNTLEKEPCINEPGVVGIASSLVRVSFEYENLAKYLLGRILVVDNIDHALSIAKKYKYSLRIVTVEGEQLNPGGSMTGGAFKNSSNLLGRRREIEDLKKNVSALSQEINETKGKVSELRKNLAEIREQLDIDNKKLREAQLLRNTAEMNVKQAKIKKDEIVAAYSESAKEADAISQQIAQVSLNLNSVNGNLESIDDANENTQKEIERLNGQLEAKKAEENEHTAKTESVKIQYSSMEQKDNYIWENISRIQDEIGALAEEELEIKEKIEQTELEINNKNQEIIEVKGRIAALSVQIADYNNRIKQLKEQRNQVNESHKTFFEKRESLSSQITSLDKECFRLNSQKEKLDESNDNLVDYMWNEYELTYSYALELRNEELDSLSEIRKMINQLKSGIKKLGDVNVNAIEEFKEVNERYTFLKSQHDDLIEAENSLVTVIDELDKGMRIQFEQKFNEIKVEFDAVFKELFGGGRGTIELVEGEDILEAGISIISQPPGKKLQNMMQLSGGEKALTAISLLFAIQNLKPSPFCLLDEIEAALDDSNVGRYANYLHKLTEHTQFIVITHRRGTMAAADRLYGITMQEKGVSALVSVDLVANELDKDTNK